MLHERNTNDHADESLREFEKAGTISDVIRSKLCALNKTLPSVDIRDDAALLLLGVRENKLENINRQVSSLIIWKENSF